MGVTNQPLSVVVTAGGSADDFHAFLESLRPSLGLRDEVVCLVPADRADLRRKLVTRSWLRVLDECPDEQGARWAAGVAATRHPLVALLDGDLVLPAHWRDPLVEQFADDTVMAVGPRCHNSFGPQGGVDPPDSALAGVSAFKAYARQWRQEHRGRVTAVDRLGPVCAVVRRDALAAAGGPTAELPYERLRDRGRIVVVQSVLFAHIGGQDCPLRTPPPPGAPLLSAGLIVKNEEAVIAECLTALTDLADEVVVYDTGSTDRTREIAREHGATVVEGYWDDHFGDARNRGLAQCSGEWVLWIDADEVVTGDPGALRERLAESAETAHMVTIRNVEEGGVHTFVTPRLFRRNRARFAGRLHEQVLDDATGTVLGGPVVPEITLVHSGYTVATFATKGKAERNMKLAELAVGDQVLGPEAVANLVRSQFAAGDEASGVATAQAALAGGELPFRVRLTLLTLVVRGCAGAGRLDEARAAFEELKGIAQQPVTVSCMEIVLRLAEENYERVLELIDAFPESAQDDLMLTHERRHFVKHQLESLMNLGRPAEAAEVLRADLRAGHVSASLAGAASILRAAGSDLAEIATLVPRSRLRWLLHSAGQAEPALAEQLMEALYLRYPGEPGVVGFVAWLGDRLPLMRALEWSARLRQHRLGEQCPLLAISRQPGRSARDRVLAAAIAQETFADQRAMPLLTEALDLVTDDEADAVLAELRVLAPGIAAAVEPTPALS